MRILLIEPDTSLAAIYTTALQTEGHVVDWAQSAQQATHKADENIPDMVILEMQLAQHNGIAFLHEFRSYADWAGIPVVLHTIIPSQQLRPFNQSLKEMGVTHILYKPQTSLRQLVDAVRRILAGAKP